MGTPGRHRSLAPLIGTAVLGMPAIVADAQSLQFSNQTAAAGVANTYSMSMNIGSLPFYAGGACGDFNRDGWQDLYVLSGSTGPDRLFINNGDGTFTDQAAAWGVAATHNGVGAAVADFDADGWLDIFVTSFGDGAARQTGRHRLYRNNGGESFSDVAPSAGVAYSSPASGDGFSASFGDYDLDGDLDLAVAAWFVNTGGNRLFQNNGDGTFTDVTATAILREMQSVRGFTPAFMDMNRDRWPELLWVADFGTTAYLVNNRDGTFSDATVVAGVGIESNGMGQTIGDFDNDRRLDWYVTSIDRSIPPPGTEPGNMLYHNLGQHAYPEIGLAAGVRHGAYGWGTVAIDFDQDGWLDIVEHNGWNDIEYLFVPPFAFRNNGNLTFDDVTGAVALDDPMDGRGMLHFDADNDGDQDLVFFNFNQPLRFYRNELAGPGANYLRVFLDTRARPDLAPDGIGARVSVRVGPAVQVRTVQANSSYLSQSEMSAHFGLGAAQSVTELRIRWASGESTILRNVTANQTLTIAAPLLSNSGPFSPAGVGG